MQNWTDSLGELPSSRRSFLSSLMCFVTLLTLSYPQLCRCPASHQLEEHLAEWMVCPLNGVCGTRAPVSMLVTEVKCKTKVNPCIRRRHSYRMLYTLSRVFLKFLTQKHLKYWYPPPKSFSGQHSFYDKTELSDFSFTQTTLQLSKHPVTSSGQDISSAAEGH